MNVGHYKAYSTLRFRHLVSIQLNVLFKSKDRLPGSSLFHQYNKFLYIFINQSGERGSQLWLCFVQFLRHRLRLRLAHQGGKCGIPLVIKMNSILAQ